MTAPELSETERLLLAAILAGGSEGRYLRVPGLSPQRRVLLYTLEEKGYDRQALRYRPEPPLGDAFPGDPVGSDCARKLGSFALREIR
jgi:hypothetical protein